LVALLPGNRGCGDRDDHLALRTLEASREIRGRRVHRSMLDKGTRNRTRQQIKDTLIG
jgi:hypothetical protein